jgi:hypothetical protein
VTRKVSQAATSNSQLKQLAVHGYDRMELSKISHTIWTLDVSRGNLNPPCQYVISHLLKMVKVMLIEYHKNVIDAANKAAATIAFDSSLLLMRFPYRINKEYAMKINSEKHTDIMKNIQRKIKTSICYNSQISFNRCYQHRMHG